MDASSRAMEILEKNDAGVKFKFESQLNVHPTTKMFTAYMLFKKS